MPDPGYFPVGKYTQRRSHALKKMNSFPMMLASLAHGSPLDILPSRR
jgi:hypothetical protein